VSPSQKADMVKFIQSGYGIDMKINKCLPKVLAIGDGGNDVSMIQQSNFGIGLLGIEGHQAARASDISITRFHQLVKLILIHGRYSYLRSSLISQYCYYKSMVICLVQLFFAFWSNFSGSSFFDSISLVSYNIFYTSLPALLIIFDKDIEENFLINNPKLYEFNQKDYFYNVQTIVYWVLRAIFHSLVLILIVSSVDLGLFGLQLGTNNEQLALALTIYTALVVVQLATIYLESNTITVIHHIVIFVTIMLFVIINLIVSQSNFFEAYNIYSSLCLDAKYYLTILLICIVCLLPIIALKFYQINYTNINNEINQAKLAQYCFKQKPLKQTKYTANNKSFTSLFYNDSKCVGSAAVKSNDHILYSPLGKLYISISLFIVHYNQSIILIKIV
jgi:phospholipid-translocating ATPase